MLQVDVIGELWMGGKGTYTYHLDRQALPIVGRSFKDFANILDMAVWEEQLCPRCNYNRPVRITDWNSPDSAILFNDNQE